MGPDRVVASHQLIPARRRRRLVALLLVVACAPTSGTVKGIVVSVDGTLTEVKSFTLLVDGDELTYLPVEDGEYAYPLPHLRDHQRTGDPVLVGWESEDGILYAVSLKDG